MSGLIQIVYKDPDEIEEIKDNEIAGILMESEELRELPAEESEEPQTSQNSDIASIAGSKHKRGTTSDWSTKESNFLVKRYNRYIKKLGSNQLFRTKRDMWQQISKDMSTIMGFDKSAFQCENRYKTLLRRWRKKNEGSAESSPIRQRGLLNDPLQSHIYTNDKYQGKTITVKTENPDAVVKTLWQIHQMTETAKERRHREKMDLLRQLVNKLK